MHYGFFFSSDSEKRYALSLKFEPLQPLILLELATKAGASRFFDVGANIGFYSLVASMIPTVKNVYAFEASPETYSELVKNVALNELEEVIRPEDKAVSSEIGEVQFQIQSSLSGINGVAETSFHSKELFSETISVACVTLDSYAPISGEVLALKIDVEGHESQVLRGGKRLLGENTCVLQVEMYEKQREEVHSLLDELGYRRIFAAKNDLYYTNSNILLEADQMVQCFEGATQKYIGLLLGEWPPLRKVQLLKLSGDLRGTSLEVNCQIEDRLFEGACEYAYYVIAGNQRIDTIWYQPNPKLNYKVPSEHIGKDISVQGFVRQKSNPDKKTANTIYLGKAT